MARIPGDPGPWGQLRYTLGLRLPPGNRDWVWHDLNDAGWRGRMLWRHVCLMIPLCAVLALLPGPWWVHVSVPLMALAASLLAVAVTADELRRSRLRRHGIAEPPRIR
ncbi:DUF5313 family protein [Actinomadura sp. LOL_016]|uniref:DUF5313 family protein n=1 Tax=unclassified Actinomadura TaxID=2626254 RepID=UPI003A7F6ECD